MWNKRGTLLEEEPSVLPYLKAIRQSLAWEGIRVNLVYRRFYSNYDLGLLLEEVRRRIRETRSSGLDYGVFVTRLFLDERFVSEHCGPFVTTGHYLFYKKAIEQRLSG